jgi:hypothetical protein
MKAIYFNGANDVMGRPAGSTAEECEDGIVHRGIDAETGWPVFTLCFKMSDEELEEFKKSGKLFVQLYGEGMPPVGMSTWNPVEQGWVKDGRPRQPNHPALVYGKNKA